MGGRKSRHQPAQALPELDQQKAEKLLRDLQTVSKLCRGSAQLRATAEVVLPLLEKYEETLPYAARLKPRLDYLQIAEEFSLHHPPPKLNPDNRRRAANPSPHKSNGKSGSKKVTVTPWPEASNHVTQLKPIFAGKNPGATRLGGGSGILLRRAGARSPVGAAGLFQLMPDTAKRFGLSLWPRDETLSTDPSARASALYLKSLYDKFKDWRLALAALQLR